ncbi:hypothetical protein [Amycolatopsis magusensis]|uniref:hypothetical protein n=1 Tax=Amycolatopsis magusensis TaxID=882444 RepID=UPI003C2BC396
MEFGRPSAGLGYLNVELGYLNVEFGRLKADLGCENKELGFLSVGFGCGNVRLDYPDVRSSYRHAEPAIPKRTSTTPTWNPPARVQDSAT